MLRTGRFEGPLLLNGRPGAEGFLFFGGHNERVYQAAPGLLGLLEARRVVERWKPPIIAWLDHSEHFFEHILDEFEGEDCFEPIRREIFGIRDLTATLEVKNRFLFQYLQVITRELERTEVMRSPKQTKTRVRGRFSGSLPETISLAGPWNVRRRERQGVYVDTEMVLPVNWELAPGTENYSGSMRFTRVLNLPEKVRGRRLTLRFGGVDYFSDVWVNGHYAGGHEGCFSPFEFDITPYVRFGDDNIIRLGVSSPNEPSGRGTGVTSGWDDFALESWFPNRKTLIKGTLGHHDAKRGGAWSSLSSQDGNTGGVWNDLELRAHHPIHFTLAPVQVTTVSTASTVRGSTAARVRFQISVQNSSGGPAEATVHLLAEPSNFEGQPHEFSRDVVLSPGRTEFTFEEELKPVALWNPSDHGFPHLYSVTSFLEVDGEKRDQATLQTGLRTLSINPMGESDGPDGAFVVNGVKVFVRGINMLPTYWLSDYTDERIRADFQMLKAAGFNAVLVHSLVAPQAFYQHAAREGFIVVQMFPLQWSYDQSPEFALRAATQVEEMAELLMNEPAVVSYEVHNEPDMRIGADVDNRMMDFELHSVLREADPYRWATTFSGGNHAYPGQFYPLRDDNSFETLPGRFLEEAVHGRRISRHRNMPTEFGIQAMPNVELLEQLLEESRITGVLARIRQDPKWISAGGEPWEEAAATLDEAKKLLGKGSWDETLEAFDWTLLWGLGGLHERIHEIEKQGSSRDEATQTELTSLKLAELLLEVLHYGAFKGENFWFGLWKPERSLRGFVESSQNRQYRIHKHAVETFSNAGATGPINGFFSFMFRDPDRQAPTWGVVDADWRPKKAYRAYLESNQPVRASLPQALRKTVKLPGDSWFLAEEEDTRWQEKPWAGAELIVTDDTGALRQASVTVWLEDEHGSSLAFVDASGRQRDTFRLTVDLEAGGGVACLYRLAAEADGDPAFDPVVPRDMPAGRCYLKVGVSFPGGEILPPNSYEFYLPDTKFAGLTGQSWDELGQLLHGAPDAQGFHYWSHGVEYRAEAGVKGLLSGFREADHAGVDLHEVVQGEHLFRHILNELRNCGYARDLWGEIWTIRSEVVSPDEKTSVLLKYLQWVVDRAEELLPESHIDHLEYSLKKSRHTATGGGRAPRKLRPDQSKHAHRKTTRKR